MSPKKLTTKYAATTQYSTSKYQYQYQQSKYWYLYSQVPVLGMQVQILVPVPENCT